MHWASVDVTREMISFCPLIDDAISISYCTASNGNMDRTEQTNEEFVNRAEY